MRNTKREKWRKLYKDRGSAMVTVIVVAGFLSVIATTLLYVTAMNYRIKNTAYKNTINFYDAETALEEVRGRVARDFTVACQRSYGKVMSQYVLKDEGYRTQLFRKTVYDELVAEWNAQRGTLEWKDFIKEFVEPKYQSGITVRYPYPAPTDYCPIEFDEVNGTILWKGVELAYEEDGCVTIVNTDVFINIPTLDWSVQGSRSSFDGTDPEENAKKLKRQFIDASECVLYSNWSKE